MPPPVVNKVVRSLRNVSQVENVPHLRRFFKTGKGEYGEGDQFLGTRMPKIRAVLKETKQEVQLKDLPNLFACKYHEVRMYAGLWLVQAYQLSTRNLKKAKKSNSPTIEEDRCREEIYQTYIHHIPRLNGWDLVDVTAPHVTGNHLLATRSENVARKQILKWCSNKKNVWERRVGMLSTFSFIRNNQLDITMDAAQLLLDNEESHDLMHKATGWMLREVGKRDRIVLEAFLDLHAATMPRTMLRYALEKFDEGTKQKYMNAHKINETGRSGYGTAKYTRKRTSAASKKSQNLQNTKNTQNGKKRRKR
jgi:3-methyladenine DNA glycosylase AlkD